VNRKSYVKEIRTIIAFIDIQAEKGAATMRKPSIFIITAMIFSLFMTSQVHPEGAIKKIQYENIGWVNPCTNELVDFTGTMQALVDIKINKNRCHIICHSNLMGVSGVGRTSGEKYQITETNQENQSVDTTKGFPVEITTMHNLHVLAMGSGSHFILHESRHFIVNADGEIIVDINEFPADSYCK
jgi:hypothetical protein